MKKKKNLFSTEKQQKSNNNKLTLWKAARNVKRPLMLATCDKY